MSVWAVIPAKPPTESKTRLASVYTSLERAVLARRLFRQTIDAAKGCAALTGVIVVSADPDLRAVARAREAVALADPLPAQEANGERSGVNQGGRDRPLWSQARKRDEYEVGGVEPSLNRAIALGCRYAVDVGASAALVLPADLLLLTPAAIARFLREAGDAAVALAPDRAGRGTNALLLRPPGVLAPAFGRGSCERHRALAMKCDLSVVSIDLPELALDLDTPDDLVVAWAYLQAQDVLEGVHV